MKKKILIVTVAVVMTFALSLPSVWAFGAREAGASLILPTTGQAMNGQLGTGKSKVMAGIEVAGIATLAILGGVVGGPVVWSALGPMVANHIWSSVDAYQSAQSRVVPVAQNQMMDAQRTLEFSRQRRYEREQVQRMTARDRIRMAGEQAVVPA